MKTAGFKLLLNGQKSSYSRKEFLSIVHDLQHTFW